MTDLGDSFIWRVKGRILAKMVPSFWLEQWNTW